MLRKQDSWRFGVWACGESLQHIADSHNDHRRFSQNGGAVLEGSEDDPPTWELPKTKDTLGGVSIIRNIIYWSTLGSPFLGNDYISHATTPSIPAYSLTYKTP